MVAAGRDGWPGCIRIYKSSFIFEFADAAQRPRRISNDDRIGRDVFCDHRAGAHQRPRPDDDAGQQRGVGSHPGKATNVDALQRVLGPPAGRKRRRDDQVSEIRL